MLPKLAPSRPSVVAAAGATAGGSQSARKPEPPGYEGRRRQKLPSPRKLAVATGVGVQPQQVAYELPEGRMVMGALPPSQLAAEVTEQREQMVAAMQRIKQLEALVNELQPGELPPFAPHPSGAVTVR